MLQKRKRHDCPLSHLSSVIFCFCLFYLNTSPFSSSQIVMCGISRPTIQGLQIQVNVAPSHSYQPEPTHPTSHTNIEQAHIWGHGKIFLCCGFIKTYIFTKQTHKKTLSIILQPLLCRGKTEPEGLNDRNNKHRLNKSL